MPHDAWSFQESHQQETPLWHGAGAPLDLNCLSSHSELKNHVNAEKIGMLKLPVTPALLAQDHTRLHPQNTCIRHHPGVLPFENLPS